MNLGVPKPAEQVCIPLPEGEHQRKAFFSTILSEIDPSSNIIEVLPEVALRSIGYEGDPSDNVAVTDFLLSTLQTHRILEHMQKENIASVQDEILTDAISRLCIALDIAAPHDQNIDHNHIASLLDAITSKVSTRFPPQICIDRLGSPLVPQSLTPSQLGICSEIHSALQKAHSTRRSLLLTRLNVTLASVTSSEIPKEHQQHLELLKLRAEQLERRENVMLYEALAAREWLLAAPPLCTSSNANNVKSFLMGNVPDRGGRLLDANSMLRFRDRLLPSKEANPRKSAGKYRGKKSKKRNM